VETDPHVQRIAGVLHAVLGQGPLDVDGAADRLAGAGEDAHEAVALVLHVEAAVAADAVGDDPVVGPQQPHPGPVAEPVGEDGGVLDVAEHDRDRAVGRRRRPEPLGSWSISRGMFCRRATSRPRSGWRMAAFGCEPVTTTVSLMLGDDRHG
jgi:hypothetical protein